MTLLMIIVAASVAALVAFNVLFWPRLRPETPQRLEPVSVLIPARNEEKNLPDCLEAVLAQPAAAEVLVYDDHSEDATAQVVARYAARDGRVRYLAPEPLPPGWRGKTFACHRLAQAATFPWLLFLDADARLAPGAVGGLLAEAEQREVTLLAGWPGLDMRGFAEKLLMPMLNFVVLTLYPAPLAIRRPLDASLGLAHGALMLARKDAYERVGGHAAVRAELFEDTLLAREWRRRGERSLCLDGQDVVRTRMYESFGAIRRGFEKNFYPAFRSGASFWTFLAFHAVFLLGPFLAGVWPAAVAVLMARLLLALRFRHPIWSVPLHPAAELVLLFVGLSSWWHFRHGAGVEWKGRRYRPA